MVTGPVHVLTTGGTIASRATDDGVQAVDSRGVLDGLTDGAPGLRVRAVMEKGSYALTPGDMVEVAAAVRAAVADGASGVVVTHGTDTMEETAYVCSLLAPVPVPVVITGAQRDLDHPEFDGTRNLADAVVLAARSDLAGCTLIVMAGRAFEARYATKSHTRDLAAFSAGRRAPVATVADGVVTPVRTPADVPPFPYERIHAPLPRVELVRVAAGTDGALIRHAAEVGAAGVVVEALGIGNAPPGAVEGVAEVVARGVVVLLTSRTGEGRVEPRYGGAGGGVSLERAGAIYAGDLPGAKARMLLALALAASHPDRPDRAAVVDLLTPHLDPSTP